MEFKEIISKISNCEKVLIGLGEKICDLEQFNKLSEIIDGKDYFIVSLDSADTILNSKIDNDRVAIPMHDLEDDTRWNIYLKWLQNTINKELLILEIGVGFANPEIIRFPFEKVAMYNNKAGFIRVDKTFYQLTKEISDKGEAVKMDGNEFVNNLWNAR